MASSSFQYTPGAAPLENLPRELYINILECMQTDGKDENDGCLSTLSNLCITSKTLHDATTPSLYQSCAQTPHKKFFRSLIENRSLAWHVQRLVFKLAEFDDTYGPWTSPRISFELISPLIKNEEFYLDLKEALSVGEDEAKIVVLIIGCPNLKDLTIDLRNHGLEWKCNRNFELDYGERRPVSGAWWLGNLFHHVASQKSTDKEILQKLTTIKIRSQLDEEGEGMQQIAIGKMIRNAARISTVRRLEIDPLFIPNSATSGSTVLTQHIRELKIGGRFLTTDQVQYVFQSCKGLSEFTLFLHNADDVVSRSDAKPAIHLDFEALAQLLHKHKNTLRHLCVNTILSVNWLDTNSSLTLNTFDGITTLILDDKAFFGNTELSSGWGDKFHDTLPPNLERFTLFTKEISPMALEILWQLILADPPKSLIRFKTVHEDSWCPLNPDKIVNVTSDSFIISQHKCSVLIGTSFRVDRIDKLVGRLKNDFRLEKDFALNERPSYTDRELFQRARKRFDDPEICSDITMLEACYYDTEK